MTRANNNNIVIKKEQDGDIINLYAESSDESSIELVNRRPKKVSSGKMSGRSNNRKAHSMFDDDPSPTHYDAPEQPVQRPPSSNRPPPPSLKDDMFEVFTNPDKTRVIDDEPEDEASVDDTPYNFYGDSDNHPGGSVNGDHSGFGNDDYDERPEGPSEGYNSIEEEKQDYLYKFYRLQAKGVPLNKKFNMNSSVAEMRSEFNRIKRDADVNSSIRFSRRMLMACVTGIEFLNKRYDPFDVKLEGWSESVMENVDDYDNVFERLHDKYASKVSMAPELELMLSLAGSAFMFHLTNSMFNSMPNLKDIAKQNPDILKNMMQSMSAAAAASQPQQAQQPTQQPQNMTPDNNNNGFREMKPPMFDMSNLMSMMQPTQQAQPVVSNFRPVGNEMFNQSSRPEKTPEPIVKFTQQPPIIRPSSPSIVSSLSSDNNNAQTNTQAKTISFSEASTVGGTRRRTRNKIQSNSSNTITI